MRDDFIGFVITVSDFKWVVNGSDVGFCYYEGFVPWCFWGCEGKEGS